MKILVSLFALLFIAGCASTEGESATDDSTSKTPAADTDTSGSVDDAVGASGTTAGDTVPTEDPTPTPTPTTYGFDSFYSELQIAMSTGDRSAVEALSLPEINVGDELVAIADVSDEILMSNDARVAISTTPAESVETTPVIDNEFTQQYNIPVGESGREVRLTTINDAGSEIQQVFVFNEVDGFYKIVAIILLD